MMALSRASAVAAVLACLPGVVRAAPNASERAGVWTVAMDGNPRQCRVQLRTDAAGAGLALAMPPGCHRALPVLNSVRSWSMPDESHVAFDDDTGQAILIFEDQAGGAGLHADGPEGGSGYTLTAIGAEHVRTIPRTEPAGTAETPPAAMALKKSPNLTVASVAGNYAVLRGDRDTGCMVTLDEKERGPKASLKAHLAPACRDQGIVIFDPIGWQLEAGHLVLTARKGHTTDLDRNDAGLWTKDTKGNASLMLKSGAPLTLKRL